MNTSHALKGPSFLKIANALREQLTPNKRAAIPREFSCDLDSTRTLEFENLTRCPAYGIELKLSDMTPAIGYRAFYLNRPGVPDLQYLGNRLIIGYETRWLNDIQLFTQTPSPLPIVTDSGTHHQWEFAFHGHGQCERFGLLMTTPKVEASYRWLVAD